VEISHVGDRISSSPARIMSRQRKSLYSLITGCKQRRASCAAAGLSGTGLSPLGQIPRTDRWMARSRQARRSSRLCAGPDCASLAPQPSPDLGHGAARPLHLWSCLGVKHMGQVIFLPYWLNIIHRQW